MKKRIRINIFYMLLCLAMSISFWHSTPVFAQQVETEGIESTELTHKGVEGVWFPLLMANNILAELELCDLSLEELYIKNEKIVSLNLLLDIRLQRIESLNLALKLSKDIEAKLENTVNLSEEARISAEERAARAEKAKSVWYRHPVLWLTVGSMLTAIIGGGFLISAK